MNENTSQSPRGTPSTSAPPPQSIPLQELQRSPDEIIDAGRGSGAARGGGSGGTVQGSSRQHAGEAPSPIAMSANLPGFSTYWEHPYPPGNDPGGISGDVSPVDPGLQFALPPDIRQQPTFSAAQSMTSANDPYETPHPYYEERADTDSMESDRVPLKPAAQPIGRLEPPEGEATPRNSFQTVSDLGNTPSRSRSTQMLGFDLEPGITDRHRSYGDNLSPVDRRRSRSPSTSGALYRASSIMRAMSQRVVMISGEGDLVEQATRRDRSRSPSADGHRPGHVSAPMLIDTSYPSQLFRISPEKGPDPDHIYSERPAPAPRRGPPLNPLKGKSLGVFPPDNALRKRLCDVLVSPWTEPFILVLIIAQAVLLAVEAAPDVFVLGNERPERWGGTRIDWAIFGLFVIFTLELVARIIVSGLIINAEDYEPARSKRRIRERVAEQYRAIFKPQRQRSTRQQRQEEHFMPTTFARSFTMMHGPAGHGTLEEQQRLHLARRAFLRHGFNRLDFIAVLSFWISFALSITGLESEHAIYVFRMLSCLRIIRLLALTKGNLVSCSIARPPGGTPCVNQP